MDGICANWLIAEGAIGEPFIIAGDLERFAGFCDGNVDIPWLLKALLKPSISILKYNDMLI